MNSRRIPLTIALLLSLLTWPALADDTEVQLPDMSGNWKLLIKNSLSRKQLTFHFEQVEGRLRGTFNSRDTGEQKCDGRVEKDGTFFVWSTYQDRAGNTTDTEFKGQLKDGKIKGKGELFERRYEFVGVRYTPKKKKKRNR